MLCLLRLLDLIFVVTLDLNNDGPLRQNMFFYPFLDFLDVSNIPKLYSIKVCFYETMQNLTIKKL